MPIVRPNPRHVSQAPTGELKENVLGVAVRYAISQDAQCKYFENFFVRSIKFLSDRMCTVAYPLPW